MSLVAPTPDRDPAHYIEEIRTCLTIIAGHVELMTMSEESIQETKVIVQESIDRASDAVNALTFRS